MARLSREAPRQLTWDEDLELICGPAGGPDDQDDDQAFDPERSDFASEAERRAAWFANRERLLEWSWRTTVGRRARRGRNR